MSEKEYTKEGLEKLFSLACNNYKWRGKVTCKFLFRNKSSSYFENIINNRNGFMEPYLKDGGNDPYNPMNGRLGGLFFMADNDVTCSSPFGNTRLVIPVDDIMKNTNLYFSDFYCLQGRSHYINLVACKPDTESDEFCREKLLEISKTDNPFFSYEGGCYEVISAMYFHVEIFITQAIDIKKEMQEPDSAYIYHGISTFGTGSSKLAGLRKKRNCSTCNIEDSVCLKKRCYQRVVATVSVEDLGSKNLMGLKSFSFNKSGKYIFKCNSKERNGWLVHETEKDNEDLKMDDENNTNKSVFEKVLEHATNEAVNVNIEMKEALEAICEDINKEDIKVAESLNNGTEDLNNETKETRGELKDDGQNIPIEDENNSCADKIDKNEAGNVDVETKEALEAICEDINKEDIKVAENLNNGTEYLINETKEKRGELKDDGQNIPIEDENNSCGHENESENASSAIA